MTLESQTPVGDFDVFAFSVSFEWDYVNVLTLLRLAGHPALRGRAHPTAHPLVVDRRRRDVRQPRAAGAVRRRDRRRRRRSARARRCVAAFARGDRSRATCCAASPASAASTSRRSTTPHYDADGTLARLRVARRRRRAAAGAQGGAARRPKRSIRRRPASSRPTPSSARASSIEVVRGCANLCRFCWAGYNYLPVRAVSDRSHPRARASGARRTRAAPAWCRSRCAITRTSSASSRGLLEMGYAISPASLRLDDLTRSIVPTAAARAASARSRSRRKPAPIGCAASSTRR